MSVALHQLGGATGERLDASDRPAHGADAGDGAMPSADKPQGSRLTSLDPQRVFAAIPREQLEEYIRPMANRMIKDIIREVRENVPEYAQPLEGAFGKVLVTCVEKSVLQVVENLGRSEVDKSEWYEWFRYVGKVEFHEGRTLDALQKSVRIGARVSWRHVHAAGAAVGLPGNTLFALADAIFGYTDELCSAAVSGYSEAQAHATGTFTRRRHQLLKTLVSEHPASPQTVAELAQATQWHVPERAAAVALEPQPGQYDLAEHALDGDILVDLESNEPCLVITDPDRHVGQIEENLSGRAAVVGPFVPLHELHRSLVTARRALTLTQRGILPSRALLRCDEHLTMLVLLADEFLLTELTCQALRPFETLTAKQRARLSTTLLTWLGTRGSVNDTAKHLDVHPQTVRYRMQQIYKLMGEKLDDPGERLMIEIALHARQALGTETKPRGRRSGKSG
ncbi:PucR C-terminal helix-turn-helix domain-containing protein [Haloechinothrix alba]|uniref:PucR C-terminal helix-turn-helix domain-containing protein n=1 Tax=Haloechinothrix alba TaxID=664784 RepID=A0A238VFM3_9PSEU|nr:PucR family transcriptional regulator [Haloechinothrix alba]SNR33056.1 PucR C-terminal helix-turn-helix domain-containing protein [Haloechinothrix alba]